MFKEITIDHLGLSLAGHISAEANARSWIIFAHGSGSSHKSPRNNWVASELNRLGHSTLLFDLLTPEEDLNYSNRFNISLLSDRLKLATQWLLHSPYYHGEPLIYFGASTGAAAALMAASQLPKDTSLLTVISRGGRPDLASESALRDVSVPVLLIVGSLDHEVITLNEMAQLHLKNAQLQLVAGATHLFEELGKMSEVVKISADWCEDQLEALSSGIKSP